MCSDTIPWTQGAVAHSFNTAPHLSIAIAGVTSNTCRHQHVYNSYHSMSNVTWCGMYILIFFHISKHAL